MKIAIVGTSKLTDEERKKAEEIIDGYVSRAKSIGTIIVTGDASGIDSIARDKIVKYGATSDIFSAKDNKWEEYKKRNMKIADKADYIFSFTTKTKTQKCYHCNEDHQRTGGCWTLKYGRSIGKDGEVVII